MRPADGRPGHRLGRRQHRLRRRGGEPRERRHRWRGGRRYLRHDREPAGQRPGRHARGRRPEQRHRSAPVAVRNDQVDGAGGSDTLFLNYMRGDYGDGVTGGFTNWASGAGGFSRYSGPILLDAVTFTSIEHLYAIGTIRDDEINAAAGDDTLYGLSGNDVLRGGLGTDQIYGGDGDDIVVHGNAENLSMVTGVTAGEGSKAVYLYGGAGIDTLWISLASETRDITLTGSATPDEEFTGSVDDGLVRWQPGLRLRDPPRCGHRRGQGQRHAGRRPRQRHPHRLGRRCHPVRHGRRYGRRRLRFRNWRRGRLLRGPGGRRPGREPVDTPRDPAGRVGGQRNLSPTPAICSSSTTHRTPAQPASWALCPGSFRMSACGVRPRAGSRLQC